MAITVNNGSVSPRAYQYYKGACRTARRRGVARVAEA